MTLLDRRKRKPQIKWTPEKLKFLRDMYPTHSLRQLTTVLNERFGTNISEKAIGFQLSRHKIKKVLAAAP